MVREIVYGRAWPGDQIPKQDELDPYPPPSSMSHSYLGDEPDVEQLVRVFAQVLDSNSSLRRCVYLRYYAGLAELVQESVRFGPAQGPELWGAVTTRS